jgi:hypothetical protein
MEKEALKANQGKIFLFGGISLILVSLIFSQIHLATGIILFAAGGILLMSLIKE